MPLQGLSQDATASGLLAGTSALLLTIAGRLALAIMVARTGTVAFTAGCPDAATALVVASAAATAGCSATTPMEHQDGCAQGSDASHPTRGRCRTVTPDPDELLPPPSAFAVLPMAWLLGGPSADWLADDPEHEFSNYYVPTPRLRTVSPIPDTLQRGSRALRSAELWPRVGVRLAVGCGSRGCAPASGEDERSLTSRPSGSPRPQSPNAEECIRGAVPRTSDALAGNTSAAPPLRVNHGSPHRRNPY